MRIAALLNGFPLLSESFVRNQLAGLLDRGFEVDLFPLYTASDPTRPEAGDPHRLRERVYPYRAAASRLLRAPVQLARGLAMRPRVYLDALNPFRYGGDAVRLRLLHLLPPLLERAPYDVVLCHGGQNGIPAVRLRALGALDGPIVTAFHGWDLSAHLRRAGRGAYTELSARGDLFLPVSDRWGRRLLELGFPPDRVIVHRMGIDTARFSFQPRRAPEAGPIRLLSVGRLVGKKGFELGIRAVAECVRRHPDRSVEYRIAGDGPLRAGLARTVRELGVERSVRLLGALPQSDVVAEMHAAHVLLAPSTTSADGDEEGIPVVIMEAMATGLPVVSTRHSGIPELVEDGASGCLVAEGDADALVAGLEQVLSVPERWAAMGREGRARIAAEYDVHRLNHRMAELLRDARDSVARSGPRRCEGTARP